MRTIDTDMIAEMYYQRVDPAYQDDEAPDEAEVLRHIAFEIDLIFSDLTEEQKQICRDNIEEIQQYVEELLA